MALALVMTLGGCADATTSRSADRPAAEESNRCPGEFRTVAKAPTLRALKREMLQLDRPQADRLRVREDELTGDKEVAVLDTDGRVVRRTVYLLDESYDWIAIEDLDPPDCRDGSK